MSLKTMNKWVKGSPAFQSVVDGHTYYFAGQKGKQMFDAKPTDFAPVLRGDCAVTYVKTGKRVPGNIRNAAWHEKRLFTFANADGKRVFLANPKTYANADLAYGGNCVVCRLNMSQAVVGKPEFTVTHKGLRYLFPSVDQRDEFLANPAKYEVAFAAATNSSGSTRRSSTQSGSSSRSGSSYRN